jgi:hypothetical protein
MAPTSAWWDWVFKQGLENTGIMLASPARLRAMTAVDGAEAAANAALVVLPIAAEIATFVALFGAPYWAAEAAYREENTAGGFSQGFVAGLLAWDWGQLVDRFGRRYLHINPSDEEMNRIRVVAYNLGLEAGYALADGLSDDAKKKYLSAIRKRAHEPMPEHWGRNEQISYVIALATAALRYGVLPSGSIVIAAVAVVGGR